MVSVITGSGSAPSVGGGSGGAAREPRGAAGAGGGGGGGGGVTSSGMISGRSDAGVNGAEARAAAAGSGSTGSSASGSGSGGGGGGSGGGASSINIGGSNDSGAAGSGIVDFGGPSNEATVSGSGSLKSSLAPPPTDPSSLKVRSWLSIARADMSALPPPVSKGLLDCSIPKSFPAEASAATPADGAASI